MTLARASRSFLAALVLTLTVLSACGTDAPANPLAAQRDDALTRTLGVLSANYKFTTEQLTCAVDKIRGSVPDKEIIARGKDMPMNYEAATAAAKAIESCTDGTKALLPILHKFAKSVPSSADTCLARELEQASVYEKHLKDFFTMDESIDKTRNDAFIDAAEICTSV